MSRSPDYGAWATIIAGIGLGFLAGWAADHYSVSENLARAAAYTVGMFGLLAAAVRPAWPRLQLRLDLLGLLVLHLALVLLAVNFLDSRSIRLNWVLALPLVAIELALFLGLLWRRNVSDSSSLH
jgi:hypothetical protein